MSEKTPITDQERAEKSAAAMMKGDMATQALGAVIDSIGPGVCEMSMTVERLAS